MRDRWGHLLVLVLFASACGGSSGAQPVAQETTTTDPTTSTTVEATTTTSSTTSTTVVTTTTTTTTTTPPEPARVLLVGDSTLLAVESYETQAALMGFEPVLEVASCRTLGVPSCGDPPLPPNSVEIIGTTEGLVDGVVIMAGYDEWWSTFPTSVEAVMEASRAKGAEWVLWLSFPESVPYRLPDGRSANEAFVMNNQTLRDFAAQPEYNDMILADWATYSSGGNGWITGDGIHLNPIGAYGAADYISRWVASITEGPCPQPLIAGGPVEVPCANPDQLESLPDLQSLYPEIDD